MSLALDALITRAEVSSYLDDLRSWPEALAALDVNLSLAGRVFEQDTQFESRLLSTDRRVAMSAVSELWLTAHFLRGGSSVTRVPTSRTPTSDFLVTEPLPASSAPMRVEVKRRFSSQEGVPLSSSDAHRCWASVPSSFVESDFSPLMAPTIKRAGAQLQHTESRHEIRVVALDLTESHTFQRLLIEDAPDPGQLRRVLRIRTKALLGFTVSLDRPHLFLWRWLIPATA